MQPPINAAVTATGAPSGIAERDQHDPGEDRLGVGQVNAEPLEIEFLQRHLQRNTKGSLGSIAPHRRLERIIGKPEEIAGTGDLQEDDCLAIGPDERREPRSRQHSPGIAAAQYTEGKREACLAPLGNRGRDDRQNGRPGDATAMI